MKKAKLTGNAMLASPVQSKESKAREQRYQGEDDLRTLTRAEEVRGDKGRMANVRGVHKDQLGALQRVGRTVGTHNDGRSMSGKDPKKGRRKRGRIGRR